MKHLVTILAFLALNVPASLSQSVPDSTQTKAIPANSNDPAFRFFPNPASSWMYVISDLPIIEVLVVNLSGQVVVREIGSKDLHFLNLHALPSGFYAIRVRSKDKVSAKSFLISR